jgi:hypothetical protein
MEGHPFMHVFDTSLGVQELKVTSPYFHNPSWLDIDPGNDYADSGYAIKNKESEWMHPISEIINSLIDAGLKIEFFHEHPMIGLKLWSFMEKGKDNYWHVKNDVLPLIFSIKASK